MLNRAQDNDGNNFPLNILGEKLQIIIFFLLFFMGGENVFK